MNKRNEQGELHGLCEWYWDNGPLMYKGNYINGERHGLCENYYSNGELIEIEYYIR
jgi:antitoxin component YwqK of YwqJK toxin-antitoxin module